MNTPTTAPCRTNSHMKCSRIRLVLDKFHDAKIATSPNNPVKNTKGALIPSTPKKYCTLNILVGNQLEFKSTKMGVLVALVY